MNSDFTSKDTSLWSSGTCTVLIASIKFSVDCSLCRDSSVSGFSIVVRYFDSSYVSEPQNNYNCDFVTRNTYRTEPNETNTNLTPTTTVTIPYIKGTSEIIARILQPYNIRVAHRPITTLRKLLTNVKDKDQPRDRLRSSL